MKPKYPRFVYGAESSGLLPAAVLPVDTVDKREHKKRLAVFVRSFTERIVGVAIMSVLDDFARIRLYRNRAAEFEQLADTTLDPNAQRRCRTVARHYRELADREERGDKARMAEHLELLRLKRREAAE
jgi:hypothetical protein